MKQGERVECLFSLRARAGAFVVYLLFHSMSGSSFIIGVGRPVINE